MNAPFQNNDEYEQLKKRNRRRLVGAGVLTLVAGGLFAMVSSNAPEPVRPQLAEQNAQTETAAEELRPASIPAPAAQTAQAETADASSESKETAAPVPTQNTEVEQGYDASKLTSGPNLEEQKRKRAAEEAKRAAAEREQAQRKQAAAKAEAERSAQQRQIAAKAQAEQQAAERKRIAERNALLAQQKETADKAEKKAAAERKAAAEKKTASDKTTADKTAEKKPAAKSGDKQRLIIHAGAYTDKARAKRAQQQLSSLNYSSSIEEIKTDKGTIYRVKTGAFPNRFEADLAVKHIHNKGMTSGKIVEKK